MVYWLIVIHACPQIYKHIGTELDINEELNHFVSMAIQLEDFYDNRTIYNRLTWWPRLFNQFVPSDVDLEVYLKRFWELRTTLSEIRDGVKSFLKLLKSCDVILAVICGNDGQVGMKNHRIQQSGLAGMFNEVLIIGETIESRKLALDILKEKYSTSFKDMTIVEDKPGPINEYQSISTDIATIRVDIHCPLTKAWLGPSLPDYSFNSMSELLSSLKPI